MKEKLMKLFRDLMQFGKLETEQGVLIYEGDILAEGTEVFIEDETGNIIPAPDGQYGDYSVVDGKIAGGEPEEEPETTEPETIEEEEEEPAEEPAEEPEDLTPRIEALEAAVAEHRQMLSELQAMLTAMKNEKEEEDFSKLKPAEKEIKDIATTTKGALKYFS